MPRRSAEAKKKENLCPGGRSYNRRRYEHQAGSSINCYRCGALMGCVWCCESLGDLICLACNNWANRAGVKRHGDVEPSRKVQHVHTDQGWRHWYKSDQSNGIPNGSKNFYAAVELADAIIAQAEVKK